MHHNITTRIHGLKKAAKMENLFAKSGCVVKKTPSDTAICGYIYRIKRAEFHFLGEDETKKFKRQYLILKCRKK